MNVTAQIVMFMICLAATAVLLQAAGVNDMFNISPETGINTTQINKNFTSYTSQIQGSNSVSLTPIGFIITGVTTVVKGFSVILMLPVVLNNLGVPMWIAAFIAAPLYLLLSLTVLYILTGRDLLR